MTPSLTCPASMMPLLDEPKGLAGLPTELLLEIFLEEVLTETDLCSLALVNRRFSRLVPVSLYDSISCMTDHDKLKSGAMSTSTIKESGNLLPNFCARPDLGSLVHVAILYLSQRLYDELIIFLKCVPALRSLSLRQSTPKWERIPELLDVPMLSLRNAQLDFYLNAEDLGKFMLLRNIRTLEGGIQTRPADPVIDFAGQAGKSSLKLLKLQCKSPNMPSRELLALPEALLEFWCCTDPYTNAQPRVPLSPRTMSLALMPTSSTLQSLVLIGYIEYDGEEIETDGSLTDFSCFTSLRSLIIIHVYCFLSGNDTQFSERRGFYRKLPPALEELTIYFLGANSLGLGSYEDHSYPEDNHKWISELAEERANSLPNLNKVKLIEDCHFEFNDNFKWHDPYSIGPTCDAAGIRFAVWLRYRRN